MDENYIKEIKLIKEMVSNKLLIQDNPKDLTDWHEGHESKVIDLRNKLRDSLIKTGTSEATNDEPLFLAAGLNQNQIWVVVAIIEAHELNLVTELETKLTTTTKEMYELIKF